MVVQVNGKLRDKITVAKDASKESIKQIHVFEIDCGVVLLVERWETSQIDQSTVVCSELDDAAVNLLGHNGLISSSGGDGDQNRCSRQVYPFVKRSALVS